MTEKVYFCNITGLNIKDAFDLSDLLVEQEYDAVSCAEDKDKSWFVEIVHSDVLDVALVKDIANKFHFADIESGIFGEIDWLKRCFENFRPVTIGRFFIYGSHLRGKTLPIDKIPIEISAATAFGSGEHPTTNRCLLALETFFDHVRHKRVLDVGCGSGILSIACAKLGASKVAGCDNDMEAVRIAKLNSEINNVSQRVDIFLNQDDSFRCAKYDFVVANILAQPLIAMRDSIANVLVNKGLLVLSGFTTDDGSVLERYIASGFLLLHRYDYHGWSAIVLQKCTD